MRQRLDQLLRRLYGPKAERFDPNQPWLIPEMAAANAEADNGQAPEAAAEADEQAVDGTAGKRKRKGHGRKPLPKDLPRRRCEHTLPEAQRVCPCCGEVCQKFGARTAVASVRSRMASSLIRTLFPDSLNESL